MGRFQKCKGINDAHTFPQRRRSACASINFFWHGFRSMLSEGEWAWYLGSRVNRVRAYVHHTDYLIAFAFSAPHLKGSSFGIRVSTHKFAMLSEAVNIIDHTKILSDYFSENSLWLKCFVHAQCRISSKPCLLLCECAVQIHIPTYIAAPPCYRQLHVLYSEHKPPTQKVSGNKRGA